MSITFEKLKPEYANLWSTMTVRPNWVSRTDKAARGILRHKKTYLIVENLTGVPWFVVGLIHQMESNRDFATHLHNGDPLSARTTNEPLGRPKSGDPPFDWFESAADALRYDKLDLISEWTTERIAFALEQYNGFRTRIEHKINTPYLWSGTNHYERGKFVADHRWDGNAVSKQVGAMPILKRLMELDEAVSRIDEARTQTKPKINTDEDLEVTELQRRLHQLPMYTDNIDGIVGPKTLQAIKALLITEQVTGWNRWTKEQLLIAGKQAICRRDGIEVGDIDGILGPQTRYALSVYSARRRGDKSAETWRDEELKKPSIVSPPPKAGNWPSQSKVRSYYGEKGKYQVRLQFPYPMRLAWDTSTVVTSTFCHEKIHDAVLRILSRVVDHYGPKRLQELRLDLFGGCMNIRRMRGGTAWSTHSWGIALDFDPDRNQLTWGRDRAGFAKPEYEKWFAIWEEEGAISLGRLRNYDWMHTQFATL